MSYTILGYNNSIHSTTKHKPIDVINYYLNTKDPFRNINKHLINKYIQELRDFTSEIYRQLNDELIFRKKNFKLS